MSKNSEHSQQYQQCVRCDSTDSVRVRLQCQHSFCLVCLSYLYVKGRAQSGSNGDQVVCSQCDRTTRLDIEAVEAIKATIEGTLLPGLNMLEAGTLREEYRSQTISSKRQAPSQRSSRVVLEKQQKRLSDGTTAQDHQPADSAHNLFVDSPKESILIATQQFCRIHSNEEIGFVCLTCQEYSLCSKCTSLKHKQHDLQSFGKAVDAITEWLGLKRHENQQKIQFCELRQRRIGEKRLLMQSKWEKVRENIVDSFEQLRIALRKRETELVESCDEHYGMLQQSLERELERINRNLQSLKGQKLEFRKLATHELFSSEKKLKTARTVQFFRLYHSLKDRMGGDTIKITLHDSHQPSYLSLNQSEVSMAAEAISCVGLVQSAMNTPPILTEPDTIRMMLPDKYTSLGSSRERTKRTLKTQEDSSGILSKRNTEQLLQTYERLSHRKGFEKHNLPSSISRFFEKQTVYGQKPRVYDSESAYSSATRGKVGSSKLLSKTNGEGFGNARSKKQLNLTKERVDYRTTTQEGSNPTSIYESSKRKRIG